LLPYVVAGIGDLDDFGSLSAVPATVKVSTSKKQLDKPRITVMYASSLYFLFICHRSLLNQHYCIITVVQWQGMTVADWHHTMLFYNQSYFE